VSSVVSRARATGNEKEAQSDAWWLSLVAREILETLASLVDSQADLSRKNTQGTNFRQLFKRSVALGKLRCEPPTVKRS